MGTDVGSDVGSDVGPRVQGDGHSGQVGGSGQVGSGHPVSHENPPEGAAPEESDENTMAALAGRAPMQHIASIVVDLLE